MLGALNAAQEQQKALQQFDETDINGSLVKAQGNQTVELPKAPRLPLSFQPDLLMSHRLSFGDHLNAWDEDSEVPDQEDILQTEFFLTQVRNQAEFCGAGISPEEQTCVRFGRPDLPKAFQRMRVRAQKSGERRVAVLVCGPVGMVKQVRALCSQHSRDGMVFDYHSEEFDF